jgi:hypothetical protein
LTERSAPIGCSRSPCRRIRAAAAVHRCAAVSSSHSPSGVAFSLIFEFGDLRLNPRVVCCADTAPQPFYLSLALPSFLPISPGVLPPPARSRGWRGRGCCRRCRRRAPIVLAITHRLPPRASSACALAGRPRCRPASSIGSACTASLAQAQRRWTPREPGARQAPPSLQ